MPKPKFAPECRGLVVKRVKLHMAIGAVARELGLVEPIVAQVGQGGAQGKLSLPGAKVVTAERMKLSRLRVENTGPGWNAKS